MESLIYTDKLWREVLIEIELGISKASFVTWFQNTSIQKIEDNCILLNVPNTFAREWIKNKYDKLIIKTLRKLNPSIKGVDYVICSQPVVLNKKQTIKIPEKTNVSQLEFNDFCAVKDSLNPKYTFDNFIIGSFNELAHAAAIAITKNLGLVYNPLFVYGGVGLGKTHLLQATGNKIKEQYPNLKIQYTTTERFANELIQSMQNNKIYDFKEKYKQYDLLIIDDVQFLAGKTKTQEEFFHIFNTLYENNKQIIFSSDRSPKSIPDIEDRLRSRFEGGMMADIIEPEYEARLAILDAKAKAKNIDIPQIALEFIASSIKNNIRELEGALNIIYAKINLSGKNPNINDIKNIFNKHICQPRKNITFGKIIKTISVYYEIEEKKIFEKTRRKEYVLPRQIAMFLLREDFNASYPYIGKKFGGRDHTTIIHAYEKISNGQKNNVNLKNDIQKLRELIYE